MKISLLHATWFSEQPPLAHKDLWLSSAHNPELIEYIVAMDESDMEAIRSTEDCLRSVLPDFPDSVRSTAVRNWNAAASIATGSMLFVISDDLFPSKNWDLKIRELCSGIDPNEVSFAIKVGDGSRPSEKYLTHPVVSRAFFENHGLFDPKYSHLYVDLDISLRAFWKAVIIDGRDILFRHKNPANEVGIVPSASQLKGNDSFQMRIGREIFRSQWSFVDRICGVVLVQRKASFDSLERLTQAAFRGRLLSRLCAPASFARLVFSRTARLLSVWLRAKN